MKYLFEVCLVGLTLVTSVAPSAAQEMTKGISVNLPVTHHAVAIPDADKPDSLIITVTENGSMYLGIDPVTPAALAEKIERFLSLQGEREVYLKADARSPYADTVQVLNAGLRAGVQTASLLTAQPETPPPVTLVPPHGWLARPFPPAPTPSSCACSTRDTKGPRCTSTMSRFPGLLCPAGYSNCWRTERRGRFY